MLTWDYRVYEVGKLRNGSEPWFTVQEVHFSEDGKELPFHMDVTVGSETIEGLRQQLQRMLASLDNPVVELVINESNLENEII